LFAATAIADPVLAVLPARGTVVGSHSKAAHIDAGGFVISVTGPGTPLMPNGVAVSGGVGDIPCGRAAMLTPDRFIAGDVVIDFAPAGSWSPAVPRNRGFGGAAVAHRARELVSGLRRDIDGLDLLRAGLRRPGAAIPIIGRGGGLTPEGDDLVAGAAAAIGAFGDAAGFDSQGWLDALLPADVRDRTNSLSATLLELAVRGLVPEPLMPVLDLRIGHTELLDALERLAGVGHSTGRAWAAGCAVAAQFLTATAKGEVA
jgi:hypothetical protein